MLKHTEEESEEIVESSNVEPNKVRTKTRAEIELDESIEQNVLFCMYFYGSSK